MSRFFSSRYSSLTPYVPGEQPKDMQYIKLNTNESPFPPPQSVVDAAAKEAGKAQLYSDPECSALVEKAAQVFGVKKTQILPTNGSDEVLNFAFMAFCDKDTSAVFPDITYGFYSVFAKLNGVPYKTLPLKEDFTVDYREYFHANATVFIANPNAPTGLALKREQIEEILKNNPDNVVVIDEAYVDFGGESALPLIRKYDNLLVTGTFSKSRSMAGARLGFGFGSPALIADLHTLRNSTNPYNVNSMTLAAGIATLEDEAYTQKNCQTVCENRAFLTSELRALGFVLADSLTNFLFVRHPRIAGDVFYRALREKGILVRHFTAPRIADYNRITIGTREEMEALVLAAREILEEV